LLNTIEYFTKQMIWEWQYNKMHTFAGVLDMYEISLHMLEIMFRCQYLNN
jgi:hypothetical protein